MFWGFVKACSVGLTDSYHIYSLIRAISTHTNLMAVVLLIVLSSGYQRKAAPWRADGLNPSSRASKGNWVLSSSSILSSKLPTVSSPRVYMLHFMEPAPPAYWGNTCNQARARLLGEQLLSGESTVTWGTPVIRREHSYLGNTCCQARTQLFGEHLWSGESTVTWGTPLIRRERSYLGNTSDQARTRLLGEQLLSGENAVTWGTPVTRWEHNYCRNT